MSQAQLSPVPFHGDTIFCIEHHNQPYTPVKPLIINMGLDWGAQSAKLRTNRERWGVAIIAIPSESGEQETTCIPVRKLPAYLASINPKKVRPELRAKIELYQAESDDALWNYWMNGRAERAEAAPESGLSPALRAELKAIVDAKLSTYPTSVQGKARAEIWTRFNRHFRIAEYAQLPAEMMPEARDLLIEMRVRALAALPPTETAAELPPAPAPEERPLIYRDGKFYPPHKNRKHVAGPREKAIMDLWCFEYDRRAKELEGLFSKLMQAIDTAVGDTCAHAVAAIGRDADTMFSISCLQEGFYATRDLAHESFKDAMHQANRYMRMASAMATALNQ